MKARILDPEVKVYSSTDENAVSIASLHIGDEVEFRAPKRKAGKQWIPITLSTGQQVFLPGEARLFIIREGSLMQNDVDLHTEPSAASSVKQQLAKNAKVYILEVIKQEDKDCVRVREANGVEGFISGDTRVKVMPQKTETTVY
jgi:hypothetical protein